MKYSKAPAHLSRQSAQWFRKMQREYDVADTGGLTLLQVAAEAMQRVAEARIVIDRDGVTLTDRWSQQKPHPAVAVERDARGQVIAALRALNLDLEPNHDKPGRPTNFKRGM